MLKYRRLILLPLFIAAFLLSSLFCRLSFPKASLCAPALTAVYDRVPVSGVITAPSTPLTCDLPLVPSAVCVKTGDAVTVGDTVAIIDRTQSVRAAAALLSAIENFDAWKKQLSSFLPESEISLSNLADSIPRKLTAPASGTVLSCDLTAGQLITPGIMPHCGGLYRPHRRTLGRRSGCE